MAEVKWIKVSTDIFDNRKIKQIEALPDGDAIIVVWVKLLCLAGNINDDGMVYFTKEIPYTDQMLATQFSRPITTIQLALKTFEQFGMVEVIDNILHISNWEKYQNIEGMEKIREQNRLRQKRWYDNQKTLPNVRNNVSVTQPNETDIDKDIESDKKKIKKENHIYSDDAELNEAILSFIAFRKTIKKPMSDRAIDLLLSKLNSMTADVQEQIAIINQSILNGWQSIYPLKDDKATQKPQKGRLDWIDDL